MDASGIRKRNTIPRKLWNVVLRKIGWTESVKNKYVVQSHEGKERPSYNTTKVIHAVLTKKKNTHTHTRIPYPNTLPTPQVFTRSTLLPKHTAGPITNYSPETTCHWVLTAICQFQTMSDAITICYKYGNYLHMASLHVTSWSTLPGHSRKTLNPNGVEHNVIT